MNQILVFVLAIVFLFSGCSVPTTKGMEVRDAWIRPAALGGNGAVYFSIRSAQADELTSISSDVAEAVEMHESMMSGDVMEMHPLQSVPLKANEDVKFEPGGLHVMLVNLKQDLGVGDEIEITLHFKNAPDLPLSVPVQESQP